jgi:hypothetical protein
LPSFGFWDAWFGGQRDSLRWLLVLERSLLGWLSRWRSGLGCPCSVTSPNETSACVLSYWMRVEHFILEDFQLFVTESKLEFDGSIGHTSSTTE